MGSSLQTHLVSYWVRKRQAFTLEQAVRMPIFDNASAWELPDRGLGAPPTAGRVLNRDG
jgi:N-acyl-D-amino-acid deacylase